MTPLRLVSSRASFDFPSDIAPSGLSFKHSRIWVADPVESLEASMPNPSREEIDAKIATSEARTDTKFARLEGKLDLVLGQATAAHEAARGLKTTIIATGLGTVLALAALLMAVVTYGDAIFSRGMSVRDVVKAVAQEQAERVAVTPKQ